jgi:hypothetical protein
MEQFLALQSKVIKTTALIKLLAGQVIAANATVVEYQLSLFLL